MQSFVKSMVLSVGLLAGTLATAQAQSVANLPPTSYVPAPTATTPAASSAKIYRVRQQRHVARAALHRERGR